MVVSATRQPNTPGVNGSGTLLGIVIRAVAPGNSALQILQVNARDSAAADDANGFPGSHNSGAVTNMSTNRRIFGIRATRQRSSLPTPS